LVRLWDVASRRQIGIPLTGQAATDRSVAVNRTVEEALALSDHDRERSDAVRLSGTDRRCDRKLPEAVFDTPF
jgi:hypothetical protein